MNIETINMSYSNLLLRPPTYIGPGPGYETLSVYRTNGEGVMAIAGWKRDKEGYELKFVGSRPFSSEVSASDFWFLAKIGQELLDKHFQETED